MFKKAKKNTPFNKANHVARQWLSEIGLIICLTGLSTVASASTITRLYNDHQYITLNKVPSFWAMIPYYVHQETEYSCAVATMVMQLNAITASENRQTNFTEKKLDTTAIGLSRKGSSTTTYARALAKALNYYKIPFKAVKTYHATTSSINQFRSKLDQYKLSNNTMLMAVNVNQSVITGNKRDDYGHWAPIAAYDGLKDRVLILDPYRRQFEPYWISVDKLYDAMSTFPKGSSTSRGYVVATF